MIDKEKFQQFKENEIERIQNELKKVQKSLKKGHYSFNFLENSINNIAASIANVYHLDNFVQYYQIKFSKINNQLAILCSNQINYIRNEDEAVYFLKKSWLEVKENQTESEGYYYLNMKINDVDTNVNNTFSNFKVNYEALSFDVKLHITWIINELFNRLVFFLYNQINEEKESKTVSI